MKMKTLWCASAILFLCVLKAAAVERHPSLTTATVCAEPLETGTGAAIDLSLAPQGWLTSAPFTGPGSEGMGNANVSVGLCTPFATSAPNPCQGHVAGYFSLSTQGFENDDNAGVCLGTFSEFSEPWSWNGTAVNGVLTNYYSLTAYVSLQCPGGDTPPAYTGDVTSTGHSYNFTIYTPFVCVNSTVPTPAPSQVPYNTTECSGRYCGEVPAYLTEAVASHGAPGMAAAAIRLTSGQNTTHPAEWETLYLGAAGRFTYDSTYSEVTLDTLYDMASCTKVITATTATAQLYQLGLIDLDANVTTYLGSEFGTYGKDLIAVHNLLVHNAGFPPDPNPGYSSPFFPCPENANYHPGQAFSCWSPIYDSVMNQTLINPVGAKYVYSDLSFITMALVIGSVVKSQQGTTHASSPGLQKVADLKLGHPCHHKDNLLCWFNAYVTEFVFKAYGMETAGFIPTNAGLTTPQWNDPWYHHELIWGYVSDQNAYAMGGISGHAGLFASVNDVIPLMKQWMAPAPHQSHTDPSVLSMETVSLFIKVQDTNQSSRALGWDTMYDPKTGEWCGTMSKKTFFHIGFTGTGICGDPVNKVFTVLLANGRYPDYHVDGMIPVRPAYNTLIRLLLP